MKKCSETLDKSRQNIIATVCCLYRLNHDSLTIMKSKIFSRLYKSMFGQMAILTVLLSLGLIYYLAVQPLLSAHSPFAQRDPLQFTSEAVRTILSEFVFYARRGEVDIARIEQNEKIIEVKQKNPAFYYFIKVGEQSFSNTTLPSSFESMKLDQLTEIYQQMAITGLCTNMSQPVSNGDNTEYGYLAYSYCDEMTYLEYSGINVPLDATYGRLLEHYPGWIWASSRNLLFSAVGVFLIFVLMLLFNLIMIRRVAAVANSFDPEKLDQKLPEEGLPDEVLPLVRAVNHMIAKVDETQKRHNFFLSTAAHEMRTPLTVLRTRLEMMDDSTLKDKLINDVRRLVSLANQLLTLMRVGAPTLPETLIDLVACCEKVISERSVLADERRISLLFNTDVDAYWIQGDKGLIEVTIANLVDNALSFSGDGGMVAIGLTAEGELTVTDSGPGIAAVHRDSLFEPFAKFPPNRNGHGLGLAIVKAVVSLHGATVDADNAPSGGARFTIRFGKALPAQA